MAITVNTSAVDDLVRGPSGPVGTRLFRTGLSVQSRAKRLCPVDTGRLRSSIQTTSPLRRGNRLVVAVGSNVHYARYVEEGTRFMRPRPYLRPALEQEIR